MIEPGEQLTPEVRDEVIAKIRAYMKAHNIRQAHMARQVGMGASTVSELLTGSYGQRAGGWKADDLEKLRVLNNWIEIDARRRNIITATPFVETTVAREIITVAEVTNETCGIGVVFGPARIGKTMTLQALEGEDRLGQPYLFRVQRKHSTPSRLAQAMCVHFGLRAGRDLLVCTDRVQTFLTGKGRMLMIDEADRLTYDQLEWLRDLHDVAACPLLLAGKDTIYQKLGFREVGTRREVLDQLAGRVVIRRDLTERTRKVERKGGPRGGPRLVRNGEPLFTRDDIRKLIKVASLDYKVAPDAIDWLQQRACLLGAGGLGQVVVHLYYANRLCADQGLAAITADVLNAVEEQVTYGQEDASALEDALENSADMAIPKVG